MVNRAAALLSPQNQAALTATLENLALVEKGVGLANQQAAIVEGFVAVQASLASEVLSQYAETRPECNTEFNGTVEVRE